MVDIISNNKGTPWRLTYRRKRCLAIRGNTSIRREHVGYYIGLGKEYDHLSKSEYFLITDTNVYHRVGTSAFRPTIVVIDDLLGALEQFSLYTETLGCIHSCIFKSIHGNLIIWYGAWIKRSNEAKELLIANLLSALSSISDLAILIDNNFFEAYAGESKDGAPVAVISTGNIISLNGAVPYEKGIENLSYAFLALFRSCFSHIKGITAGVCLQSGPKQPRVICLSVWDSLHACYSWILNSDSRSKLQPFVDHLSVDIKYDICKVVFASTDAGLSYQFPPQKLLRNAEDEQQE